MRINETDIIEEIEAHMRKCGGDFSEWCVGTAKNAVVSGQLSVVSKGAGDGQVGSGQIGHELIANTQTEGTLLCREAYTPYAADEVIERLVQGWGLRRDQEAARERGRIVFVYRKAVRCPESEVRIQLTSPSPSLADQPVFRRRAV